MKNIIIFILLIAININSKGQSLSEYYDAIFIRKYCYNEIDGTLQNKINLVAILKKYFPTQINEGITNSELINIMSLNPFFAPYVPSGFSSAPESIVDNSFAFSSLGNLDVTTIADGFAKFIVDRTKKELQASFFDRFIEQMKKDEYKDIQTLFPATYLVVKRIPEDVYNYEKFIQSLRNAFGTDIGSLLPHLESVMRHGKFSKFFNTHLELKSVCLTALYYGKGLQNNTHIGELIEKYKPESVDYKLSSGNADTIKTNAIRFIQEVSKSFRTATQNSKEYWVPADSIMMLADDKETFNIYLGLLYQRVNTLKVDSAGTISYGGVMATMNDNVNKIKSLIVNFSQQLSNAQTQLQDIESKVKKDRTINDYIDYFTSAISVLNSFKENDFVNYLTTELMTTAKSEINNYWTKYADIVEGTNAVLSIYNSIKQKNYSVALNSARTLYQMRFDPDFISIDSTKEQLENVIEFLLEKGAFIASVAEAKTSEEVYKAIDAIAMPVGSARVKRLSNFNIAVNAYCGLFAGNEIIKGFEPNRPFTRFNTFGIAAPIGFTMSKGKRYLPWPISELYWFNKSKTGWSTSWFISLIDLGALTAYRFSNDSIDQVPTIQLKDIFSPGIFWSLGLPKSPISINFGAQLGPNLRKVHELSNDYSNNAYFRYSVSVCVDLPVLNLYTRSR